MESPYVLEAFFGALVWCSGGYAGLPNASHHSRGHICPGVVPGTYWSEGRGPWVQLRHPEEISTILLRPTQEEDPLEESLPFAPDAAEEDLTPEQEKELLEEEEATPRPPTPSDKAIIEATRFTPSDLPAYEYASA